MEWKLIAEHNSLPNHCVQATPDCGLLFILAQVSGAPDADRSASRIATFKV
jgi:hypothetical protein